MSALPPLNVENLINALEDVDDWRGLGTELSRPHTELTQIELEHVIRKRKAVMLHRWLYNVRNPSWQDIVSALRRMKLTRIAQSVQEKYCPTCFTVQPESSAVEEAAVMPDDQVHQEAQSTCDPVQDTECDTVKPVPHILQDTASPMSHVQLDAVSDAPLSK